MKSKRKNDWILILLILVIGFAGVALIGYSQKKDTINGEALVTIDGKEYGRFPLDEDRVEHIQVSESSYNILEIRDGHADITDASCPDSVCVDLWKVSKKNQSIVCLPNKLVVTIVNGAESDVDMVTN